MIIEIITEMMNDVKISMQRLIVQSLIVLISMKKLLMIANIDEAKETLLMQKLVMRVLTMLSKDDVNAIDSRHW